ncbi:Crp/Fnr family transcriptional regulator [Limosilactobacillus mucosae]|uniref:Crp/Fnr family transcriptional regulator n=1 Tax=Limosilactobacillus mucosae TaxID=97478 RepID=UPI0025A4C8B6|nr:Crp/Fnr family transcriptional regulator [Limosilactobacillus mucosae]MDM8219178.1 Crp/Fnr family transcriptional regulator [Limosilactobacillus mucosae]MDM8313834.1 Crp/Fnr family transcriptional regulator [Limosilactobacillus mucosae]
MTDHIHHHQHLCVSTVPLFNQLALSDQQKVESLVRRYRFSRGDQILAPGEKGQMIIVESGAVKIYQLSLSGQEHMLRMLAAGEHEGEAWLFGIENVDTFAQAERTSEICTILYEDFAQLLNQYPSIAMRLLQLTLKKNRQLAAQNHLLGLDSIEERLKDYLKEEMQVQHSREFTLPMKLKDLATYLGTTPETISRKIQVLERQGLIRHSVRKIQILADF